MPIVTSELPFVQQKLIDLYQHQMNINNAIREHPDSELMKQLKEEIDKEVKETEQKWIQARNEPEDRCFVFR